MTFSAGNLSGHIWNASAKLKIAAPALKPWREFEDGRAGEVRNVFR